MILHYSKTVSTQKARVLVERKKSILFIVGFPLESGGHIHSTLSYVTQISQMKADVFLLARKGPLAQEFAKVTKRIFYSYFLDKKRWMNLCALFKIVFITLRYNIDIIYAQDFQSLRPALLASRIMRARLIYTKAGGIIPRYKLPKKTTIIVFSEELYNGIAAYNRGVAPYLMLIKPRIDTAIYKPREVSDGFKRKFLVVESSAVNVAMCMRLEGQKRPWIETFLRIAEKCIKMRRVKFMLVGYGSLYGEVLDKIHVLNKIAKRELVRMHGRLSDRDDMVQLYNYASIIIGHGRGILEAMACGKCVVCIGDRGRGTLVSPENVDAISYYNFSGRHLQNRSELGCEVSSIINSLSKNRFLMKKLGIWGRQYIEQEYDSSLLSEKIVAVHRCRYFAWGYDQWD